MARFITNREDNLVQFLVLDVFGHEMPVLDGDSGEIALYTKEELLAPSSKGRTNGETLISGMSQFVERPI